MNMNDAFIGSLIFNKNEGGGVTSAPLSPNPNAHEVVVQTAELPTE